MAYGVPDQCGGPPWSGLYRRNSPPTACVPRAGSPGAPAPDTPPPGGWLSPAGPAGEGPRTTAPEDGPDASPVDCGPDASPVDCGPVDAAPPFPAARACLAAVAPCPASPGRARVGLVSSQRCISSEIRSMA